MNMNNNECFYQAIRSKTKANSRRFIQHFETLSFQKVMIVYQVYFNSIRKTGADTSSKFSAAKTMQRFKYTEYTGNTLYAAYLLCKYYVHSMPIM